MSDGTSGGFKSFANQTQNNNSLRTMKKVIYYGLPLLAATSLQGATLTSVIATGSPSSDGWAVNFSNPGDGSQNGEFNGDSANNGGGSAAGAGATAWALYANTDQLSEAFFTLAGGALTTNQVVSLDFDNGPIDQGGSVGVTFLSGGVESLAFTIGGADTNYGVTDDGGFTTSPVTLTSDGLNLAVTLTGSGAYSLNAGGTIITGNLKESSIDQVRVFNFNAGSGDSHNVFFNNLSVTAVPEPSSTALLGLGGLSLLLRRRRNS